MKARVKKLWVDALRSGDYKQCRGQLRRDDTFCVYGVLCNLHAQAHPEIAAVQKHKSEYMGNVSMIPGEVLKWANLTCFVQVKIEKTKAGLAYQNDHLRRTFAQLANAIEAQL